MLPPVLIEPLVVERIEVAIAELPPRLDGTTIVQLSDFHFDGRSLSRRMLQAAIAHSNAVAPDLVVLTGDFITHSDHEMDDLVPYLRHLKARYGVYAIFGNHDNRLRTTRTAVGQALVSIGVCPLWNEIAYPLGADFPLVGLADYYSREFQPATVLPQLDDAIPRLVLSHNPDSLVDLKPFRADLVLAGHTHGGQVWVPGWGPVTGILQAWGTVVPNGLRPFVPFLKRDCDRVLHHWEWAAGLHRVGRNQLYVNRGLGSYFPGRLFCPPEVTVIRLVQEGRGSTTGRG